MIDDWPLETFVQLHTQLSSAQLSLIAPWSGKRRCILVLQKVAATTSGIPPPTALGLANLAAAALGLANLAAAALV